MYYATPKDLMERYQISRSTVHRVIKDMEENGKPVLHIGRVVRVLPDDFEEHIREKSNDIQRKVLQETQTR